MSTLCLQYFCHEPQKVGKDLTVFRVGRTLEELGHSNMLLMIDTVGEEEPEKRQVTLTYAPGRKKDVLWAFSIEADKYTSRLDRIHEVTRTLQSLFRCGTQAQWRCLVLDWLVYPEEEGNLR